MRLVSLLSSRALLHSSHMGRRANKKKGSSSGATPTSASEPLKFTLPARHSNTGLDTSSKSNPPVESATEVPHGPEPETAVFPASDPPPAIVFEGPTVDDYISLEILEQEPEAPQDVEILAANLNVKVDDPVTPPAAKLLADFFTLEDSQDEGEATPLAHKPKQSKKSLAKPDAAELEEKAQRKLSLVPINKILT